ncbi:glycosyltransferase [Gordonia sp. Z-3]|uniref:glycosyltransferase n=1 Tax=Gordonia sp. Z-3 TaxID=3115408 RepID=UPI003FA5CC7C
MSGYLRVSRTSEPPVRQHDVSQLKRIAFLVPSLAGGGAEFVAKSWAQALSNKGIHVTVIQTHPKPGTAATEFTQVALGGSSFWQRVSEVRRAVRACEADVVLAMMPYWNNLLIISTAFLGASKPAIAISGRNMVIPLVAEQGFAMRVKHWMSRLTYRHADAYVAISHPVAAEAQALYHVSSDRTWVIPNPSLAKEALRPHVDRSADQNVIEIVVPARLVPQKRPQLAVDIAHLVAHEWGYAVRLKFFGKGPLAEPVAERCRKLGIPCEIRWSDTWYDECGTGVVLLPSLSEGFGNVLLEAARSRIWVVASSRCLGVADAIIPEVTGILTAGDRACDYAAAVVEASRRPTPAPPAGWLQRFSSTSSAEALESALLAVVRDRGRR